MLLGTRSYSRTRAMVTVICSDCGVPGPHALRDVGARLLLLNVPTVALGPKDVVLECRACRAQTQLSALYAERLVADDATARSTGR